LHGGNVLLLSDVHGSFNICPQEIVRFKLLCVTLRESGACVVVLTPDCLIGVSDSSTQKCLISNCCACLVAQAVWIVSLPSTCLNFSFNCILKGFLTGILVGGRCLCCLLQAGTFSSPMHVITCLKRSKCMLDFLLCQVMLGHEYWKHGLQNCAGCSKNFVHIIRCHCGNGILCH
jgi:hypothetical protein